MESGRVLPVTRTPARLRPGNSGERAPGEGRWALGPSCLRMLGD